MLKIWGRKNSINVQKVLWCCGEIGLKYERVDAGMQFGVVNTPEYRKLNPNGLVPTIEDDGFVLWESHAIVRYLARRHGRGKLWPENDKACADADRWMDWYNTTVWPNMRTVFWNLVRVPPEKRDVAAVEEARKKLAESFAIADARLAGNDYLAGKEFTMGDIPMGVAAYRWFNLPIERPAHRNVERWYQRICERPAYKEHCMLPLT
ncbi:MAG: glutathione S-transferase family protein [Betaproteobacteria bacterium]|nr:glutathione S-transferase family protein [Betaproteobacteria bacterium]